MRANLKATRALGWVCAALMAYGTTYAAGLAQAEDLKLQSQLLWGTDDAKPPEGKNYKPVEPDILKRLKELPLKWKNYFDDKCELNVVRQNNSTVEVALIGRGKEVVRRTQSLPRGQILVLGGNAPNATAWLVILKRTD
jgi:hypothetical protein